MSRNPSDRVQIRPIIGKLGHSLEEIRTRALNNILSKLEHNLVSEADLVQEKLLLVALLEWFNFPNVSNQDKVMALLLRLSRHSTASQILLDVGAVTFFTQLRSNMPVSLQPLLDQILENLFRLPDATDDQQAASCVYNQNTGDDAQSPLQANQTSPEKRFPYDSWKYHTPSKAQAGYFNQTEPEQGLHDMDTNGDTAFKFSSFPWLTLTPTDKHVLSSTDSSLCSKDESHVVSACEFLSDVVMKDFPAEIFIQRPAIIKSLLSLLLLSESQHVVLCTQAAQTLRDLCSHLLARLHFYQDPVLYTPKLDAWSSQDLDTSPRSGHHRPIHSPRSRGDGRDRESSSRSSSRSSSYSNHLVPDTEIPMEELEDLPALQFAQMSLPHFCISVMERAVRKLKTENEAVFTYCLQLLFEVNKLLEQTISLAIWDDSSTPARDMMERLSECFEKVADALHSHRHSMTSNVQGSDVVFHRLSYIGSATYAVNLLLQTVPVQKAKRVLPESLLPEMFALVLDETISASYPEIRQAMAPYLEMTSHEDHVVYQSACNVCHSMRTSCKFLMESQTYNEITAMRCLILAEGSLASLAYHQSMELVDQSVKLTADICSWPKSEEEWLEKSRSLLLKLLAFPVLAIKLQAYKRVLLIIKNALDIETASDPNSKVTHRAIFLIDRLVLYEICCFGMTDNNTKVSNASQEIMLHLLQSQLLLPEHLWAKLLQCITCILPVLQGFADVQSTFGQCIMGLSEPEPHTESAVPPRLERLRGTLRMMYSTSSRVRSDALTRLAWYLSREEDASRKRPAFSDLDITKLSDVFALESPLTLEPTGSPLTVFSSDEMLKVFEIFHSNTVEPKVKKSAADQLAIMLQDSTLHKAFLRKGGFEKVVEILKEGVTKPSSDPERQADIVATVPACLVMLQYVLYYDSSLRHRLAHEPDMYLPIVRCCFLFLGNETVRGAAASSLALLLFDEVTTPDTKNEGNFRYIGFRLPAFITNRYKFPFKTDMYDKTSSHCMPLAASPDPLLSPPVSDMLKIAWNLAWHGDMKRLLDHFSHDKSYMEDAANEFSPQLKLTAVDKVILRTTHLQHGIKEAIYGVCNASSHKMVDDSILRMKTYLIISSPYVGAQFVTKANLIDAFKRFLLVVPASSMDENLLAEILCVFSLLSQWTPQLDNKVISWLEETLEHPKGPILTLISRPEVKHDAMERVIEAAAQSKRHLNRCLLLFVNACVGRLSFAKIYKKHHKINTKDLSKNLCTKLNVGDAPYFYNLASLESTIQCLMHVTSKPGWSLSATEEERFEICHHILSCLLEVVSAIHLGRADSAMSYMGRGVSKNAALCLCHLSHEMQSFSNKQWPMKWLHATKKSEQGGGQPGLDWLLPLWAYRDPTVRAAGLGIAVGMTTTEVGRVTMVTCCQHLPGGIWGIALEILLDQTECSIVRKQAALLLTNLTSQPMPSGMMEAIQDRWTGPVIRNEDTGVSLAGVSALLILLHHSQFYHELLTVLSNYYTHPIIQPVCIAGQLPSVGSQSTLITSASSSSHSSSNQSAIAVANTTVQESIHKVMTSTPAEGGSVPRPPSSTRGPSGSSASSIGLSPSSDSRSASGESGSSKGTPRNVATPPGNRPGSRQARASPRGMPSNGNARIPGQGQSSREGSPGSQNTDQTEYQAVAAPSLIASICRLLSNLITLATEDSLMFLHRENILQLLHCMLEDELLDAYITEITASPEKSYLLSFSAIMDMYASILTLMKTCAAHDGEYRAELISDTERMKKIAKLLSVKSEAHPELQPACYLMQTSVYNLFTALLTLSPQDALTDLTPVFVANWEIFCESLTTIISSKEPLDLRVASLNFLATLMKEEGRKNNGVEEFTEEPTVGDMLKSVRTSCLITNSSSASGAILCETLVAAYDVIALKPTEQCQVEKLAVIGGLKCLLAVSADAKQNALDAGLVESISEHIKHTHTKLSAEAVQLNRTAASKKKDETFMSELILTYDLVRNFMYQNEEIKISFYKCNLSNTIHKLWAWCQMEPKLMTATLSLLATFTARCNLACSSLAYTSLGVLADLPMMKPQLSSNSLIHCLIKLASREQSKDNQQHIKMSFSILATVSCMSECRGILWKSNFLHKFSTLAPNKMKKQKEKFAQELRWLHLMANLSFTNEGQQMIMKIKDSVDLLLEYSSSTSALCQHHAVLSLRNLSFHSLNKPKLLANENVIPCFLKCINHGTEGVRTAAASALWALIYNNQKAKVVMKNFNVGRHLNGCLDKMAERGNFEAQTFTNIEAVLATLQE
ncbi:rotatin-like [Lineus longissimus]|uniref:rotatin-like n=1 Tax=Lineus longissimus TaxID=88925 RepID=UPI002B4F9AAA